MARSSLLFAIVGAAGCVVDDWRFRAYDDSAATQDPVVSRDTDLAGPMDADVLDAADDLAHDRADAEVAAAPDGNAPDADAPAGLDADAAAFDADTPRADVPADGLSPDLLPSPRCGAERPSITGTTGAEGIVISPDGTIYFSQSNAVGRITPAGTRDNRWAVVAGASTMWGLAYDAPRNRLYAGSPTNRKVHAIDLSSAPPTVTDFVTNAGGPNGLTMGPDGFLYYSDFTGGQVYRVDGTGAQTRVTTTSISGANGLAFNAAGNLLVLSYSQGRLYRLTLTDGAETGRTMLASGLGNPDGIALDAMGNLYVTDQAGQRLVKLDSMGGNPETLLTSLSAPANIEFGCGVLRCADVYVATGSGIRRYEGMVEGAAVPWHR